MFSSLFVCLLASLCKIFATEFRKIFRERCQWASEQTRNPKHRRAAAKPAAWLYFGGDLDHRLETGIVFRIRHYWEIRKVVSTDCAARRCSARHALAGVTIATVTSQRHRPTTDSHDSQWRRMTSLDNMSVYSGKNLNLDAVYVLIIPHFLADLEPIRRMVGLISRH